MTNETQPDPHARIVAIVEALTGERHEVTTQKRRSYWYAICGRYESPKGSQGVEGEQWAVDALLAHTTDEAERAARHLRFTGRDAEFARRRVEDARKRLVEAERCVADEATRAAEFAEKHEARRASSSDRDRAAYDVLYGTH